MKFFDSRLTAATNFELSHLMRTEVEAKKSWDKFYLRNSTNFFKGSFDCLLQWNDKKKSFLTDSLSFNFKDRHWTKNEFKELITDNLTSKDGQRPILLELGLCWFYSSPAHSKIFRSLTVFIDFIRLWNWKFSMATDRGEHPVLHLRH